MGAMNSKQMKLDDRLESYGPFFDHQWARSLFAHAETAPRLYEPVFDLTMAFKGVSTTAALPRLSVDFAKSFAEGAKILRLSDSMTMRLVDHIAARLEQKNVLSAKHRQDLKAAMLELAEEIHQKVDHISEEFPRQELWESFVKVEPGEPEHTPKNELRLALWASQRIAYSALFFAYEDFFVRCLTIRIGKRLQSHSTKFTTACRTELGASVAQKCWLGGPIRAARRVRNALAHSSGRLEPGFGKSNQVEVVGGELQILPADVSRLHDDLKKAVNLLVEWAVNSPSFQ